MAKGDDIEERLVDFAVRIVKLSGHLPNTQAGKHTGLFSSPVMSLRAVPDGEAIPIL